MRNSSPVVLGEIIADKYQVEGVIGEGGMGLVVSAWHLGLRQRVAIKLLLADGGRIEEAALERFQREARAAARIRSEHVCRVLDVGMLPGGTPYLVLEYLEGCDLADELTRRGRLPANEAIGYVLQACEALAEAHAAGIIHRDLKPANLFLARRANGSRVLKLLDFGVSKSLSESSVESFSLTKTSSIIGSPIYMSPEQLNSAKDVDVRTDIWALGALTYELIAGRPPFFGDTIPQLVSQVLHTDPTSFAELGLEAPAGLEAVLIKALSKPRDQRYASVGEFATAVGPYAPDDSISVSRILQIRPSTEAREPLPATLAERDAARVTPRRTPLQTPARAPGQAQAPYKTPPDGGWHSEASPTPAANASRGKSNNRRWAWAALALIVLAGVAAVLSRQMSTGAASRELVDVNASGDADAGQSARPSTAGMLPPSLPELPTRPTPSALDEPPAGLAAPAVVAPPVAAPSAPGIAPSSIAPASTPAGTPDSLAPGGRAVPRGKRRSDQPLVPSASEPRQDISNFGGRR